MRIQSPSRLNSVVRVRGCSLVHVQTFKKGLSKTVAAVYTAYTYGFAIRGCKPKFRFMHTLTRRHREVPGSSLGGGIFFIFLQ